MNEFNYIVVDEAYETPEFFANLEEAKAYVEDQMDCYERHHDDFVIIQYNNKSAKVVKFKFKPAEIVFE